MSKPERRESTSSVLMGMLGAWLWTTFGKKLLDRIPVWWRIVGGLLIGAALLFIDGLELLGWALLLSSIGLAVVTITRRVRHEAEDGPSAVASHWTLIVEENAVLQRALRGSRARVLESDASGFTICVELAGGHTPDEVQALTPNLESVFHTEPGALRIYGDPTAAHRALLRAGDVRPGTQKPRTPDGPIIDMPVVEAPPPKAEPFSLARVMRGRARPRTRTRGVSEAVRLEELKRKAALARQRGERSGKGGHKRRAR